MNNSRLEFADISLERLASLPLTSELSEYIETLDGETRSEVLLRRSKNLISRITPDIEKRHNMICVHATHQSDADTSDLFQEYEVCAKYLGLDPDDHVCSCGECNVEGFFDLEFILVSKVFSYLDSNQDEYDYTGETPEPLSETEIRQLEKIIQESDAVKAGTVYFLLFKKSKLIKIGYTAQIDKRLRAYSTHSAESFSLIKTVPGTKSKEKNIHKDLKSFRRKGEFFQECEEVMGYINRL